MPHPQTLSLKRPCPSCGGALQRKTVNPQKPLGMVACSNCQFKKPIDAYAKIVQADVKAKAQQRKVQG